MIRPEQKIFKDNVVIDKSYVPALKIGRYLHYDSNKVPFL